MKANELRIGNWLYNYKGTPVKIMQWSSNGAYLLEDRKAYGIKTSAEIELTDQWVEKFGFEFNHLEFQELGHYVYQKDGFAIQWNDYINQWMLYGYDLDVEIKYVHQLQNLYFALTGEEL